MSTPPGWLIGLVIVLPLAGSLLPLLLGLRYRRAGWPVTVVTLVATIGAALPLLVGAARGEIVRFEVGGISAAYGVELVIDAVSGVLVVLALLIFLGATIHTRRAGPSTNAVHSGILLLTAGTLGITLTGDFFNLYVFLEISAIASYALISSADSEVSTYAAFKYLLLGTVGASLYLLGVAYVFIATGTLNMRSVSLAFAEVGHTDTVVVASFVLITVGLAIKIALFPVHTWLADAHAAAPDAVSAIVSGLLPAVAVYVLARIALGVYTTAFFDANPAFEMLLLYGSLLTVIVASIFALLQHKIKLLLAYSTIAQMGLAVVGVALANDLAVYGAMLQLFGHGVVKAGLFLLAGLIAIVHGARTLDGYRGLAGQSPWLAGAFALLGISLVGLPPTVGFMAKYYIVLGAIEAGSWFVAVLVIASTLLTVAYVVPIIDRLYFHDFDGSILEAPALPRGSATAVAVAVGLAITIGTATVPIAAYLGPAIEVMVG